MRLFTTVARKFVRQIHISSVKRFQQADEVYHELKIAGYQGESYKVKTEDGYILKLHRVLPKKHSDHKGSAFLMHGLFRSSSDFLASGPKIALAYYLSDNGWDVWMGNARGSKCSNEHKTYANNSKEFWNFSFHEIGLYDVSAMLNFMLDQTKEAKTFYVGHSQGASALLALLSLMPDYNDKIIQAHLLTPAVFLKNAKSLLLTIPAKHSELLMKFAKNMKKADFYSAMKLSHKLCNFNGFNPQLALKLYKNLICTVVGKNKKSVEISQEALKTFHSFMSPAVSMMQLTHFLQLHVTGKFQQFNHGAENLLYYGSRDPPEYKLQNVSTLIHLYSSSEDLLISPKDVEHLKNLLPNVQKHEIIHDWNHMDVMFGRNSRNYLYKNILKSMNENVQSKT